MTELTVSKITPEARKRCEQEQLARTPKPKPMDGTVLEAMRTIELARAAKRINQYYDALISVQH